MNYLLFINKYWFFRYKIFFINTPKPINKHTKNTKLIKVQMSESHNAIHYIKK